MMSASIISESIFSPEVKLSSLRSKRGQVIVVRDDLLPGGTKQRACVPFLQSMLQKGFSDFIYASPFSGFAQVALSYACQQLGIECHIVCEKDQRFPNKMELHPFTELARSYGARITLTENLEEAERVASGINVRSPLTLKLPLGFDCTDFRNELKKTLLEQWRNIELRCPQIRNLWLPLGSGTLARTFHEVIPANITLNCVNVHVLGPNDFRISSLAKIPRVKIHHAPMKFHEPAKMLPEIPSNVFYDAKTWEFISNFAEHGDLWWNVAR